ncbi:MAG: hypothetical protein IT355_09565 [Gemmatimonadaceae bacterium]|nr:hypothetical protein [Gemmatimonadaceae bacterium]
MSQWSAQQAEREWERRANAFVSALLSEPDPEAVEALSRLGDRDADHARWELRYLRRALGLLIAGRDALDDRTASLVGQALARAVEHDPSAAPAMRAVSAAQFNARLRVYRDLMGQRGASRTPIGRIGEALVGFAGGRPGTDRDGWASAWVGAELDRCNEALRQEFGTVDLPEDIPPSAIVAPRA